MSDIIKTEVSETQPTKQPETSETLTEVLPTQPTKPQTFEGWAEQVRFAARGKLVFIDLYMGGSPSNKTQLVISGSKDQIKKLELSRHCALRVVGEVVCSKGAEQEYEVQVKASDVTVVGKCDTDTYPIAKTDLSMDYLRSILTWRSRTQLFKSIWVVRDQVIRSIHDFYKEKGYLHIHAPLITKNDCEGAGEVFSVVAEGCEDFFGRCESTGIQTDVPSLGTPIKAFLTVSGQLQGEVMACSIGPIYTLGPTFRAEKSSTSRHLSEFLMMEPEIPFATLTDIIDISISMLKFIGARCIDVCYPSLKILDEHTPGLLSKLKQFIEEPAVIMTYTEAVEKLVASGVTFKETPKWGIDLGSEHETWLCGDKLTILTDYPKEIKAFYMYETDGCEKGRETVACMDVLLPGIGEVIGGSQRESRLEIMAPKMERLGLGGSEYDFYRDLRRFGYPGSSGFGLGVERMVRFVTGITQIRDVIPFPVAYKKIYS